MRNRNPASSARERWGEWVIVVILFLVGVVLYFASPATTGLLRQALESVSFSFLSTSFATGIILAIVGSNVSGLKKEVDKLHGIIEDEIDTIYSSIGNLSSMLNNASNLGIIGLGRSGQSPVFEENKNFVERWKYFLEYAHEVDVICFADRSLFSYHIFDRSFKEKIRVRMAQEGEKGLKLRIIISSEDNPSNKEIDEWSGDSNYTKSRIEYAKIILSELCGGKLTPDIVREHKNFVPFTILRGDRFIYVMFFIPGYAGGPVIEIRPLEMIAYPRIVDAEDDKKLFHIYKSYFEDMWRKCEERTSKPDTPLAD
jgi:hypothetical protein